ncbi:O-antigen/teichoic acid export membrane protein [Cellulophaga sp. RHA_52]|uniref:lipopolysaccharide biosynthesis protein n=1 Tax=Cellulophaga sp. RHA_52 TaxID=1250036 RepID=UPI0011991857|nr:oligosaccharide flippase family protein [Cellulophaga sp. RHA_52]TVZ08251.1 O-antigen/teichoic acid export membrane protein [Cellulophaga sp. RHA_52]
MKRNNFITFLKNRFTKSEFSKNVFTLISGTAIAQLIPLLIAPILSRIYTPEEFGRLALYLSITQVLGGVSSGRYELAIVLPTKKKEGVQLTLLSIFITIVVSLVSLVSILLFSTDIANFLGDPKLDKWLYFVPLSVLMIGIFNALNYFNTREKAFQNIAKANVYKSFGGNGIQFFFGIIKYTSGGLIIGQVFSHFFGNIKMLKTFVKNKKILNKTTKEDLKGLAMRYVNFPKFSVWGIFLNLMSINIINVFISSIYSLSILGYFSHAYRYLGLPSSLLGNAFSQVYLEKSISDYKTFGNSKELFLSTVKKLSIIAFFILIGGILFIEEIFVLVFGNNWIIAGKYAKILIPLFSIRFVASSLSVTFIVYEIQKESLFWHFCLFLLSCFLMVIFIFNEFDVNTFLYAYTILLFMYYFLFIYRMFIITKGKT